MDKEKLEGLIIDYIDGQLHDADRRFVEQEILNNEEARKLYEELKQLMHVMDQSAQLQPSPALKTGFEKDLQAEISGSSGGGRLIFFRPSFYRAAAAVALMVLSGAIGYWISKDNAREERLVQMEKEMEITRKQLAETKQLMMGMLDNELSASQRIKGVNVAMEFKDADDEIVGALINTMLTDKSTNVRLAALDALVKFQQDPAVKKGLIDALSKQNDPMVQIKLIQLLVGMKEKEVIRDLQDLVDDAGTMQAVKDEAYSGILKLS